MGEMEHLLGIHQPTLSQQLRVLRAEGLGVDQARGQEDLLSNLRPPGRHRARDLVRRGLPVAGRGGIRGRQGDGGVASGAADPSDSGVSSTALY